MTGARFHSAAHSFLGTVLNHGSFQSWDEPTDSERLTDARYRATLSDARERSGVDEAVVTGKGLIGAHPVAIVVSEFAFLAGSIGVSTAARLVRAVERATAERLPLIAAPASGGTRMQEGTPAFVQMIKIAAAVADHRAAGLPYLVYLRHPTTGGVLASWASLGHITFAEPGALVGFLGPRVYRALHGRDFPAGVQVADNLHGRGLLDGVIEPCHVRDAFGRVLALACTPFSATATSIGDSAPDAAPMQIRSTSAWDSITRSRSADRPGLRQLLSAASDVVALHGTGAGETAPGLTMSLARFGSVACVCIGHDRDPSSTDHSIGPNALRAARRGIRLAQELRLPLLTVIDTPGAALSVEAEEGGLAGEIARCLTDLATVSAPTMTLLLGQGAGGAALAFLPADRIVACQHSWLSALPPEGASALLHRSTTRAAEVAQAQRVSARYLLEDGIVDRIVPENYSSPSDANGFCRRIAEVISEEFMALRHQPDTVRLRNRRRRIREMAATGCAIA